MTVQEFQAGCIERAGRLLAHFLDTTPADKRDWLPAVEGAAGLRSALDQAAECILVNRYIAGALRGEQPPAVSPLQNRERPFVDAADAQTKLVESADELAAAVRALSDDDLRREFPSRRGPTPGYLLIEVPLRNMHYHGGQINLLQMCYGDTEFRPLPLPTQN